MDDRRHQSKQHRRSEEDHDCFLFLSIFPPMDEPLCVDRVQEAGDECDIDTGQYQRTVIEEYIRHQ